MVSIPGQHNKKFRQRENRSHQLATRTSDAIPKQSNKWFKDTLMQI